MTEDGKEPSELRRRAEEAIREGAPLSETEREGAEDARRLVLELRVHQVELELQNEELRETRAKVEESLAQYLDLYEFAPVPYITVDRRGSILKANLAAATELAVPRSRLVGRSLLDRIARELRPSVSAFLERTVSSGCRESFETELKRDSGEAIFARIVGLGRDDREGECRLALIDITDREKARAALDHAGKEKTALMRELQHRVKNSLTVVNSLLGIGKSQVEDPKAKEVLGKASARVLALSRIYEQLYLSGQILEVDLATYLERLIGPLLETYSAESSRFTLVARFERASLDAQRAALAGLILSELVSNATKYAYPSGESGELRVSLLDKAGMIELRVSDDGPGLPSGLDPATTESMGFHLLRMLADQMDAELSVASPEGRGVDVTIRFKP